MDIETQNATKSKTDIKKIFLRGNKRAAKKQPFKYFYLFLCFGKSFMFRTIARP